MPAAAIVELSRCGSHFLVFSWAFHGGTNSTNIWRTNADGTSPVKLSDGKDDRGPVCSADEKWVYYWDHALQQLWRAPSERVGKTGNVSRKRCSQNVSPPRWDSVFLQTASFWPMCLPPCQLRMIPILNIRLRCWTMSSGASPAKLIDADERISSGGLSFTPDGRPWPTRFVKTGWTTFWCKPLDGAPWSADHTVLIPSKFSTSVGRRTAEAFASSAAHTDSDVVLINESSQ